MSAYIVDKTDIDRIVQLAEDGPAGVPVSPDTAWRFGWYMPDRPERWHYMTSRGDTGAADARDALGQILTDACVRSVAYRYSDDTIDQLPGPVDKAWTLDYHYERPDRRLTAVEGLKLLAGYEYQSCEHPDWETSEAHAIRAYLRDALIDRLPGYSEAAWTS